jgi:glycosyltransferase involved in cell wall biosynthesis
MRGGERALNVFCKIFPQAELFTLIHEKGSLTPLLENRPIHTSFLQNIPGIRNNYRSFLPLFPLAVESFDLTGFDLIISSSHCVAKGARKPKGARHFCYCYTPMRYMWVFFEQYFGSYPAWKKGLVRMFGSYLKKWDIGTLPRVDEFISISRTIHDRIKHIYNRESKIIYCPVEVDKFRFDPSRKKGDYYVCVSALVPYKRIDIMIDAFNSMPDRKLVIVGDGNMRKEWQAKVRSPNTTFTGWLDHDKVVDACKGAKAFIYAAFEDFGIAPVEAQALGLPVIAYGKGGTSETVIPINSGTAAVGAYVSASTPPRCGPTGIFFNQQTPDALISAIKEFERRESEFDPVAARRNAERFSEEVFVRDIRSFVKEKIGRDCFARHCSEGGLAMTGGAC